MTLKEHLSNILIRVAAEFKKTEKLAAKNTSNGYCGLDANGKVPVQNLDFAAFLTQPGELKWTNNKIKPTTNTSFTMSFDLTSWYDLDTIQLVSQSGVLIPPTTLSKSSNITQLMSSFTIATPGKYTVVIFRMNARLKNTNIQVTVQ